MDALETYRQIIQKVLNEYIQIPYAHGDIKNEYIVDCESTRYLVMTLGWQNSKRVHGCLLHIEIINGKVWIQRDGTEHGIAKDLVRAGIPKEQIVLGFQEPTARQYTEYAAA